MNKKDRWATMQRLSKEGLHGLEHIYAYVVINRYGNGQKNKCPSNALTGTVERYCHLYPRQLASSSRKHHSPIGLNTVQYTNAYRPGEVQMWTSKQYKGRRRFPHVCISTWSRFKNKQAYTMEGNRIMLPTPTINPRQERKNSIFKMSSGSNLLNYLRVPLKMN